MDLFITLLFAFVGFAFVFYLFYIMLKGSGATDTNESDSTKNTLGLDCSFDGKIQNEHDYNGDNSMSLNNVSDFTVREDDTKALTETYCNHISGYEAKIPKHILDLLWFINGERKNCNDYKEPSAIDVTLSVELPSQDYIPCDIGYYPSYINLSPTEKAVYLNWLCDITQPIPIGYVFIFYYGLERWLFTDSYKDAVKVILTLREFHNNHSFLSYSADALLISSVLRQEKEFLDIIPTIARGKDKSFNIAIAAYFQKKLSPELITATCSSWGFTNRRYINEHNRLFLDIMQNILAEQYTAPYFPLTDDDISGATENVYTALANYSLRHRIANLKDITSNPKLKDAIFKLLVETHERVKGELYEMRTGKPFIRKKVIDTDIVNETDSSSFEEMPDYDIETGVQIENESEFLQNTDMTKLFNSPFKIQPGVLPPIPWYNVLNKYEYVFFSRLKNELVSANIKGECILTRLSYGTFNVNSDGCYVGKVRLRPVCINREYPVLIADNDKAIRIFKTRRKADNYCKLLSQATVECRKTGNKKFAVLIPGESKALRLFSTDDEANDYKDKLQQAYIYDSTENEEFYIQYFRSEFNCKDIYVKNLEAILALLPYWVKRIKKHDNIKLY